MDNYARQLLALSDDELERFVREWVGRKTRSYVECTRFSGAGDMGRDVVGFLSTARHEGPWHNYQCKQYGGSLPTATGLLEIGKVLYFSHKGHFKPPEKYVFVAPRGLNRNLEALVFNPTKFKSRLLDEWDKYCADAISEGERIPLDAGLRLDIETYEFSRISRASLDDILLDSDALPVLSRVFGSDPGPPPATMVPPAVTAVELPYVMQLVDAYGERDGAAYTGHTDVEAHPRHGAHFARQRERFFTADAFKRFYRDNTDAEVLEHFEEDVYHGVVDIYDADHRDALERIDSVMSQAAKVRASGPLDRHARVPVRQGLCHHFANDGRFRWRR